MTLGALLASCTDGGESGSADSGASESADAGGDSESGDPPADLGVDDTDTAPGSDDETDSDTGDDPCEEPMPCLDCECIDGAWSCDCEPMVAEAGFYTIEPITYSLGAGADAVELQSSTSRLFYSFHPADSQPYARPLFLIFNGGPAVSSGLLMGTNTGPMTIDPAVAGEGGVAVNPATWTAIGNLLYVDPRTVGFSYGLMEHPDDDAARDAEFRLRNFNCYLDAADYTRVVLRFLADHPQLAHVPVIVVAESYGGTRAGILLNLLLFHSAYADGSQRYVDPALVDEIESHLELRFPEQDIDDPTLVAQQFVAQVLIQPSIAGVAQQAAAGELFELEGSPMDELGDELDVPFVTCAEKGPPCDPYDNGLDFVEAQGRSVYDISAGESWLQDLFDDVSAGLGQSTNLAALLGVDLEAIAGMAAADRALAPLAAYRVSSVDYFPTDDESGDLGQTLGPLAEWDRYFMVWNYEAFVEFTASAANSLDVDPYDAHHGETFLHNLLFVETFITDASEDVIVHGPSIAPTLARFDAVVADAHLEPELPAETPRPGLVEVTYVDGAFPDAPPATHREIRQPTYEGASHSVTLDRPSELRDDVARWLVESGRLEP